jgi:hypothetical protein
MATLREIRDQTPFLGVWGFLPDDLVTALSNCCDLRCWQSFPFAYPCKECRATCDLKLIVDGKIVEEGDAQAG